MRGRRAWLRAAALVGLGGVATGAASVDTAGRAEYDRQRERLLREVDDEVRATAGWTGIKVLSAPVRRALGRVERHRFVPPEYQSLAYANRPLPIGHAQTISQPFIVAIMTELLAPRPEHTVLEVGTGSGYQAAVLAECVKQVHSIEIVEPLAAQARTLLAQLGYQNVQVRIGDGYRGWPDAAPFDGIIVTAAPDHVPQPLIDQLKPGGRLVIPVGGRSDDRSDGQELLVIVKSADGSTATRRTVPVRFVPLTRAR